MLSRIYQVYNVIDGCIGFALISYMLCCLCGIKKEHYKCWHYVAASTTFFFITERFTEQIFNKLFGWNPIYLIFMISFAFAALISAHVFLQSSFTNKLTYILFFLTFIQLYKIVCSPLYELEYRLSTSVYSLIDMASGVVLYILLFLLSLLFRKTKISQITSTMPKKFFLILYFPLSVLLSGIITSNTPRLWVRFAPILAAIIISNLPIIYYFFTAIINAYEQQRQLDTALQQTKAQLSYYRYSIVMQDEIKKQRHELKNNYFYIQTMLVEKKYEELEHYLSTVMGEKLSSLEEIKTGITLMDYILNQKISECRRYGIKVYTEILIPKHLRICEDALCTILLNILDNAIQASRKEDNADIHIDIRCVQGYLVFKVKNKTSYNVLKENPRLLTTKSDQTQHGFGVRIIRETVAQNNGILDFDWKDGYFVATVMLEG